MEKCGYRSVIACSARGYFCSIDVNLTMPTTLFGIEWFRPPMVDNEQAGAFERGHQPRQPAFTASLGEIGEQARSALVEHREALTASFVT
jgi:hypothetical protein